jgi:hypothetical protein
MMSVRLLRVVMSFLPATAVDVAAQAESRDSASALIVAYRIESRGIVVIERDADVVIKDSGECRLHGVVAVSVRDNGVLAVANWKSSEICLFDNRGKLLRRFGRDGNGPGEYQMIRTVRIIQGDTLIVFDGGNNRLTATGPSGVSKCLQVRVGLPGARNPYFAVILPDGRVFAAYTDLRPSAPEAEPVFSTVQVVLYDRAGAALTKPIRLPHADFILVPSPPWNGGVSAQKLPFGRELSVASLANGFVAGEGTDFRVDQYSGEGKLIASHRWPGARRPVRLEDIDALKRDTLDGQPAREQDFLNHIFKYTKWPKTFPAYRRVMTDPKGRVWIQSYLAPGDSSVRMTVLDPQSRVGWEVSLPERLQLLAVSSSHVCGMTHGVSELTLIKCYRYSTEGNIGQGKKR